MNVLTAAARAVDRRFYAPAPAVRLAAVRVLIGGFALGYLLTRAPHLVSPLAFDPARYEPVGIAALSAHPLSPLGLYALAIVTTLLAVPFVLGFRFRVTAPLFAVALLWLLTYRNSWAKIFHTENLLVIQVAVLSITPAADALSLDARHRVRSRQEHPRYGWPLSLLSLIVVSSYLLAAIAKLEASGLAWLDPEWMRNWVAYDNLRKIALGHIHSPLGAALVPHRWVFPPLAFFAMAIETGAPVALLHPRIARVWAFLVIAFHWGVLLLMAVAFPYHMSGIPFASFFHAERLPLLRRGGSSG